jgi:hypothetical protein
MALPTARSAASHHRPNINWQVPVLSDALASGET